MKKSESKYFNTAVKMNMALISLLEKKEFSYITVSEICRAAGVNRSTFYLHYETIGDLLAETTRYLLDDFLSYFPADTQAIATHFRESDLSQLNFITDEYLHPYLRYIREHGGEALTWLLEQRDSEGLNWLLANGELSRETLSAGCETARQLNAAEAQALLLEQIHRLAPAGRRKTFDL